MKLSRLRQVAVISTLFLLVACTTPAKTYKAPSNAKVTATTADLNLKVQRAREAAAKARATAAKARTVTQEARESAAKLVGLRKTVADKLEALKKSAPPEIKAAITDIQQAAVAQGEEEAVTLSKTTEAVTYNAQLALDNEQLQARQDEEEKARRAVIAAQDEYQMGAIAIASDATKESAARYKAQSQLLQQKILRWALGLGGGAILITGIILFIAWKMGKIGVKYALK